MMTTREAYLVLHEASGIKVGDVVRVRRKAEFGEMGWDTNWIPAMDKFVGCELHVVKDSGNYGFILGIDDEDDYRNKYLFPFYVLEVVKKTLPDPLVLNLERPYYQVEFLPDGMVRICGLLVDIHFMKEAYHRALSTVGKK